MGTMREAFLAYPLQKSKPPCLSPHILCILLVYSFSQQCHLTHYTYIYFLFLSTRMEAPLGQEFILGFFWLLVPVTQWINIGWMNEWISESWMNPARHSTLSIALSTPIFFFLYILLSSFLLQHLCSSHSQGRSRFCEAWSSYKHRGQVGGVCF